MAAPARQSPPPGIKRLINELNQLPKEPNPNLMRLGPINDSDLTHWEAVMHGVPGSAYESGLWLLSISIPEAYPHAPPTIKFVTPICHPNIKFKTGEICLDLLKEKWSPAYTISSTLTSIYQLLSAPNPESPENLEVAALLRQGDLIGAEGLIRWCCGEWRYNGR